MENRIKVCVAVICSLPTIRTSLYVSETTKDFTNASPIDALRNMAKLIDDFNDAISSKILKNVTFRKNMANQQDKYAFLNEHACSCSSRPKGNAPPYSTPDYDPLRVGPTKGGRY